MGLRGWIKKLERDARGDLESFVLEDGSRFYYDRLETYKEMFLHAMDVQLGRGEDWLEPPEIYRKMLEARDPAEVLKRFEPENPQVALVNVDEIFDADALVNERRLVLLDVEPVEDLSEP